MGLADRALDKLDEKTATRLNQEERSETQKAEQTGVYQGFDASKPYGSRHVVKYQQGTVYGELITPTALSKGKEVAVYLGKINFFDGL